MFAPKSRRGIRRSISSSTNAGVTQIGLFGETTLASQRRVMEINYFGSVVMAAGLLSAVRAGRGTHLAISSVAGFAPLYKRTAYAASKHALNGFFSSLAAEEAEHGVTVAIAAPSFVSTNPGRLDAGGGWHRQAGSCQRRV